MMPSRLEAGAVAGVMPIGQKALRPVASQYDVDELVTGRVGSLGGPSAPGIAPVDATSPLDVPTVVLGDLYEHLDDDLQEESPQTGFRSARAWSSTLPATHRRGVRATGAGVART